MNRAVEALKKCGVFYLATMDGDQPRVRPFGAVAEMDGKLYICTSNQKDCYKQMTANPKVELSGCLDAENWIRISGTVKTDPSLEAKTEFLRQCPLPMYRPDDGIFEVLYLEKGAVATQASFTKAPEQFEL